MPLSFLCLAQFFSNMPFTIDPKIFDYYPKFFKIF